MRNENDESSGSDYSWENFKRKWIREKLNDPHADENSPGWEEMSELCEDVHRYVPTDMPDIWKVEGKPSLMIFNENMNASSEILQLQVSHLCQKNLLVMLHAHVVTALEAYLSSSFIEKSLGSDVFIKRLVESDPEFAKRKFTIQEIFTKRASLEDDVRNYLKELIFHNIAKVKEMYKFVFDIDFLEVTWLFKAVALRHDCVHRAGYDKDGNEVQLDKESIALLIKQCSGLVETVESKLSKYDESDSHFMGWCR